MSISHSVFHYNLKKYLEIEIILNDFFQAYDFCLTRCILPQSQNNHIAVGCCKDKYYKKYDLAHPSFDLLRSERERRFGSPDIYANEIGPSPCEYHTPQGCRLRSHKSPICLSFMCRESIDRLRECYRIFSYDYLGMHYALEWILTGDLKGSQYDAFKVSCLEMVAKISI